MSDVAAVALRPVGNKDFVLVQLHPPGAKIMLHNGTAEEIIALLRAVAVEGFGVRLLLHSGVEGLDNGRRQGPGHVTDGELDDFPVRVGLAVSTDAPGHLAEEIAAGQLQVVVVDVCHENHSLSFKSAAAAAALVIRRSIASLVR